MFCHFSLDGLPVILHYWYCKKKKREWMEDFREGGGRNHFVSTTRTTINKVPATCLVWDGLGGGIEIL